jgi:outer membrane protein OmpA-like peptidoglycan-associated protein
MGVIIKQPVQISCHGHAAASLRVEITGGKSPYTYQWSNGKTTATLDNLPAGDYSVTVTDVVGTSFPANTTIKQPEKVTATVELEAAATTNQADGKAAVKANGGTGAYKYTWDNGESSAKAVKLKAGPHTVTVSDESGCTAVADITMTENITSIAVQIQQIKGIACAGNREAAIEATVNGGKPPYTFVWNTNAVTSQIQNLDKGVYKVTVTDASGQSAVKEYEVISPQPMGVEVKAEQVASANRTDGRAVVLVTGGTGKYTYQWSNGETTPLAITLGAGKHTVNVYDGNGCIARGEINMTENITAVNVKIIEGDKINCPGDATASLQASYAGGKAPYTVLWKSGTKEWNGDQIENIPVGTYTLEVTDASGQQSSAQWNVTEPKPLQLNVFNIRSATNDRLKDGKAQVESLGGTGSCSFLWSSGETLHQAMQLPLGPGYVVATDANGCSARADFVIKEKVLPELTADRLASGEPLRMEKIQFQADSVRVNDEAIPSLDELYEFLYDNPTVIIEVAGHTNSLPADDYCDRISSERANSVAAYIIGKGIESRRVIAKGYGKRKPIATNQTSEGRKKNQRVEIRLIKIEE